MLTGLYAALLAIMACGLSLNTIKTRRTSKTTIGVKEGDNPLQRAVRAQANFLEYTPLFLILLTLTEMQNAPTGLLHTAGIVFVCARALHAFSLLHDEPNNKRFTFRVSGMQLTIGALMTLAGVLLYQYALVFI